MKNKINRRILPIALAVLILLTACSGVSLSPTIIPTLQVQTAAPIPTSSVSPTAFPSATLIVPPVQPSVTPTVQPAPALTGRLAMLSGEQVKILDLQTGQTVQASAQELLGWSPSAAYLLVRCGDRYAVLSAEGKAVYQTGALPQAPQWIAWSPNGDLQEWLAVPNPGGSLDLLSLPSGKTKRLLPEGTLGEDGRAIFHTSQDGYVVFTPSLDQLQKGTRFGGMFEGMEANGPAAVSMGVWRVDDKCCGAGSVGAMDYYKGYYLPVNTASHGEYPLLLAAQIQSRCSSCAADGLKLYAMDTVFHVQTLDTGTVALITPEAYAWNPVQRGLMALAEGGSRFVFEHKRLALLDLPAGTLTYLTGADQAVFEPAWSPDGRRIAYTSMPAVHKASGNGEDLEKALGGRGISVYDLSTGKARPLTQPDKDSIDGWPRWTADGKVILYARKSLAAPGTQVRAIDIDTGQERLVAGLDFAPQFCHRGCGWDQLLAFAPGPLAAATPVAALAPTPTSSTRPGEPRPGWTTYQNPGYGFQFSFPDGWDLDQSAKDGNWLKLTRDSYALTIGFRRPSQVALIQRTGTGAGDVFIRGRVNAMGQPLSRCVLEYGGKVKAVMYNSAAEFRAGGLVFTLSLDSTSDKYEDVDIPSDIQTQADQIVASFKINQP